MSTSECVEDSSEVLTGVSLEAGRKLLAYRLDLHVACILATIIIFAADIVLPRGATPAIGYCLVPVLARATGRRSFVLALTGICTILTWVGYILEPSGAALW